MWLVHRISVAVRAGELLEQKQRLLRREQRRLVALADRTGTEWGAAADEVAMWTARAMVTGGRADLRRSLPLVPAAGVRLGWANQVGVVFPSAVDVDVPAFQLPVGNPALGRAAAACRRAVEIAVRHAAATAALANVERELTATVRRLRAVRDRWLPMLRGQLRHLELSLDETEREEITRLRWVGRDGVRTEARP